MTRTEPDLRGKDFVDQEGGEIKKKRRSRKTIGEEGSRRQTAIGLIVTIGLGLFFYLPTEFKNWWQGFNSSETITIVKPVGDSKDVSEVVGFKVVIKEKGDAEEVVGRLLEDLRGSYGVYVKSLKNDKGFSIKADRDFGAASIAKLPLLVSFYEAVDKGQIDPEAIYVLKEKDRWVYGTGSMQNQPAGTKYTYREVAYLVANQSDNMGAQIMSGWLDEKIVEEMTPLEAGKLLEEIYNGKRLSQTSRDELLESLTNTVNEDRITAGVPSGIRVAHKFGSEAGVVNDCGIVYADEPYVICLMSDGASDGEAQEVWPKVSRVIWEWLGES